MSAAAALLAAYESGYRDCERKRPRFTVDGGWDKHAMRSILARWQAPAKWLLVKTGKYDEKGEVHSIAFFDQHDDGMGPGPYVLGDFPRAEAAAIVAELNRVGADPAALASIRAPQAAPPVRS